MMFNCRCRLLFAVRCLLFVCLCVCLFVGCLLFVVCFWSLVVRCSLIVVRCVRCVMFASFFPPNIACRRKEQVLLTPTCAGRFRPLKMLPGVARP